MKLLSTLTTILFSANLMASSPESQYWSEYHTIANNMASSISSAPLSEISTQSILLTKLSTKLLPRFVEKHAICKEYIETALNAADTMTTLSLEAIEKDYHADGKLPPVKSVSCYHAKDLLVHPATMAVIAQTQADNEATRDQISLELEEVLAHFNQVKIAAGF